MKKIFTLFAATAMVASLQAQVVMVDPSGKEYTDGETMTIAGEVDPDWGDVVFESPSVKNNGSAAVTVKLGVDIKQLPELTAVQECFGANCTFWNATGSHDTSDVTLAAGDTKNAMTEWQCYNPETDEYTKGVCIIEFTIYENGSKSAVVTVKYVNGDDANIQTIMDENAAVVEAYTMLGQKVPANYKGVVIQKLADGSIRKVVNK